jgi:thymidylate synthase (FAD)
MKVIQPSFTWHGETPNGDAMLRSIAAAGRVCYQSEANGKSDADFVRSIIARGHESVIEHEKISVQIICDRGVTHEAVRHRIASYSQESTRYCNYSKGKFGGEVTFIDISGGIDLCPVTSKLDSDTIHLIVIEWWAACKDAERHYMRMIELGASPQIARSVLNNSTKTAIVVTMNLREWRHFFKLREAPAAHPQIREIAIPMLEIFRKAVPVIFDDLEVHS